MNSTLTISYSTSSPESTCPSHSHRQGRPTGCLLTDNPGTAPTRAKQHQQLHPEHWLRPELHPPPPLPPPRHLCRSRRRGRACTSSSPGRRTAHRSPTSRSLPSGGSARGTCHCRRARARPRSRGCTRWGVTFYECIPPTT